MARAFLLVLDSVGVGSAPDAASYGDDGANTVGHIAEACASGGADRAGVRSGRIQMPNLARLGFGEACRLATGKVPPGLDLLGKPEGRFACAAEVSAGKDTPSGHWEIAGVPVTEDWYYFPNTVPAFPRKLVKALCEQADLPGILGDCHASGTEIITRLGEEHARTGYPICYTSADSVFQIAAHEDSFGLNRLYEVCRIARKLLDPLRVGRVIARPFVGSGALSFTRTANRRDYTVPPPAGTILSCVEQARRAIITIGKVADIFAHACTGQVIKAGSNSGAMDRVFDAVATLPDGGLTFANLNDFDTLYGHRRDVVGYAAALEQFDSRVLELRAVLKPEDLVIITADHGCDPTWRGTDHTREFVPIVAFGEKVSAGSSGVRSTFSDIGATVLKHLGLAGDNGTPLWS